MGESNGKKFQKSTKNTEAKESEYDDCSEEQSETEADAMEVDDDENCLEEDSRTNEDVEGDSTEDDGDFSEEDLLDEDYLCEGNAGMDDSDDEDGYGECREVDTEKDPLDCDEEDYEDLVKV